MVNGLLINAKILIEHANYSLLKYFYNTKVWAWVSKSDRVGDLSG